ncbi:hypothetical protein SAMN05443637_12258 [Pseudonocardia thermophila]|uniref:Uncharacterized protein n=1 Tax=Pseudonocardia thermophila TaxID=1848 RepID=A0A1M6Z3H2_PSETH|nr:hypothetical protein SAMN05443637_12258 [Pseudonocardia thermophila]
MEPAGTAAAGAEPPGATGVPPAGAPGSSDAGSGTGIDGSAGTATPSPVEAPPGVSPLGEGSVPAPVPEAGSTVHVVGTARRSSAIATPGPLINASASTLPMVTVRFMRHSASSSAAHDRGGQ